MTKEKIRAERLAKLQALRDAGVDPYGRRVDCTGSIAHVRTLCPETLAEGESGPLVTIAGRVIAIRDMGKSKWLDLRDRSGRIQANLLQARLGESFSLLQYLDIGDFLAITGNVMKSKKGEITVFATSFSFLCKNIEPLPTKWKGLRDVEIRYRRRYLDLLANDATRERFILRSRIIGAIRRWLDDRDFLEVETPMLQAIYGGAAARPFITHHNALGIYLYLRISPETYLKRLLVGGLDRVYEINRNFRNEGIDTSHNPEFTMIEIYQAYADFEVMMDLTETLIRDVAQAVLGRTTVTFGDATIELAPPGGWPRRRISDLLREVAGVDPENIPMMREACLHHGLDREKVATMDRDRLWATLMDEVVEPQLIQPTFVTHYPASLNPLCKRNAEDPTLTDRFEVIVAGMELANAFSELNDPFEQRARFEEQIARAEEEGYCNTVDEDYISALEVGMPPAGGLGIGIDRLVMLLTGQTSIREVILFPTLKPPSPEDLQREEEEEDA